jgi:hypothetical protein
VRLTVGPAIDRNPYDAAHRAEAAGTQHAAELVADAVLEGCVIGPERFGAAGPVLVTLRQSGVHTIWTRIGSLGEGGAPIRTDIGDRVPSAHQF